MWLHDIFPRPYRRSRQPDTPYPEEDLVAASLRQILLPSVVFAMMLVLGASAGWSGADSGVLAALVAIMVAAISTMVTATPQVTNDVTNQREGERARHR